MKNILKRFLGRFPAKLPKGATEFEAFADKILSIYQIPNLPSYRHAIANMILHQDPTTDRIPLSFFAKSIHKAMSNEIAWQVIQDIKKAEAEKQKAEAESVEGKETPAPAH